jgi:hypothetical protein
MEIVEVIDESREKAIARETFWIQDYAKQGAPLLNNHHHRGLRLRRGETEAIVTNAWDTYIIENVFEQHVLGYHPGSEPLPNFSRTPRFQQGWEGSNWLRTHGSLFWLWGTDEMSKYYKKYPCLHNFTYAVWASLGLLPLEEALIHRLLRKELNFEEIQPNDILLWESGHQYTGYIVSALYREGRQQYQARVFQHALVSLAQLGIRFEKLYIDVSMNQLAVPGYGYSVLTPSQQKGSYLLRLAKEHYFTPEPTLSQSAWVTYPGQHSLSLAIQAYQKQISLIQQEQ